MCIDGHVNIIMTKPQKKNNNKCQYKLEIQMTYDQHVPYFLFTFFIQAFFGVR